MDPAGVVPKRSFTIRTENGVLRKISQEEMQSLVRSRIQQAKEVASRRTAHAYTGRAGLSTATSRQNEASRSPEQHDRSRPLSTGSTALTLEPEHGRETAHLPPLSPTFDTEESLSDFDSQSSPDSRYNESSPLVEKRFWSSSMDFDTKEDVNSTVEGSDSSSLKHRDPEIIFLLTESVEESSRSSTIGDTDNDTIDDEELCPPYDRKHDCRPQPETPANNSTTIRTSVSPRSRAGAPPLHPKSISAARLFVSASPGPSPKLQRNRSQGETMMLGSQRRNEQRQKQEQLEALIRTTLQRSHDEKTVVDGLQQHEQQQLDQLQRTMTTDPRQIEKMVQETVRKAREAARQEISEILQESVQMARVSAEQEILNLVQSSVSDVIEGASTEPLEAREPPSEAVQFYVASEGCGSEMEEGPHILEPFAVEEREPIVEEATNIKFFRSETSYAALGTQQSPLLISESMEEALQSRQSDFWAAAVLEPLPDLARSKDTTTTTQNNVTDFHENQLEDVPTVAQSGSTQTEKFEDSAIDQCDRTSETMGLERIDTLRAIAIDTRDEDEASVPSYSSQLKPDGEENEMAESFTGKVVSDNETVDVSISLDHRIGPTSNSEISENNVSEGKKGQLPVIGGKAIDEDVEESVDKALEDALRDSVARNEGDHVGRDKEISTTAVTTDCEKLERNTNQVVEDNEFMETQRRIEVKLEMLRRVRNDELIRRTDLRVCATTESEAPFDEPGVHHKQATSPTNDRGMIDPTSANDQLSSEIFEIFSSHTNSFIEAAGKENGDDAIQHSEMACSKGLQPREDSGDERDEVSIDKKTLSQREPDLAMSQEEAEKSLTLHSQMIAQGGDSGFPDAPTTTDAVDDKLTQDRSKVTFREDSSLIPYETVDESSEASDEAAEQHLKNSRPQLTETEMDDLQNIAAHAIAASLEATIPMQSPESAEALPWYEEMVAKPLKDVNAEDRIRITKQENLELIQLNDANFELGSRDDIIIPLSNSINECQVIGSNEGASKPTNIITSSLLEATSATEDSPFQAIQTHQGHGMFCSNLFDMMHADSFETQTTFVSLNTYDAMSLDEENSFVAGPVDNWMEAVANRIEGTEDFSNPRRDQRSRKNTRSKVTHPKQDETTSSTTLTKWILEVGSTFDVAIDHISRALGDDDEDSDSEIEIPSLRRLSEMKQASFSFSDGEDEEDNVEVSGANRHATASRGNRQARKSSRGPVTPQPRPEQLFNASRKKSEHNKPLSHENMRRGGGKSRRRTRKE